MIEVNHTSINGPVLLFIHGVRNVAECRAL